MAIVVFAPLLSTQHHSHTFCANFCKVLALTCCSFFLPNTGVFLSSCPSEVCAPKPDCRGRVPRCPHPLAPLGVVDSVTPLVTFWMVRRCFSTSEVPHKTVTRNNTNIGSFRRGRIRAATKTHNETRTENAATRGLLTNRSGVKQCYMESSR